MRGSTLLPGHYHNDGCVFPDPHYAPKLQPGDEHDTVPPKGLFTDEQAAPGSDD